jgi:hypothetical protein
MLRRGIILTTTTLIVGVSHQPTTFGQEAEQNDAAVPVDLIPRLAMFESPVDYRESLRCGTLAPDAVVIDSVRIHTAMPEPQLLQALGDEYSLRELETFRSRHQQWDYLRRMASQHDDSMHYYIIAHIYYDRQLSGWFKVYDWRFEDVLLRAHLWRPRETDSSRIWLIHAVMDTLSGEQVSYLEGDHLALIRRGRRVAKWDVQRNELMISEGTDGGRSDE